MKVLLFTEKCGAFEEEKVVIFNSNVIKAEHIIKLIESGEYYSPYFIMMNKLQYDVIFASTFGKLEDMEEAECLTYSTVID